MSEGIEATGLAVVCGIHEVCANYSLHLFTDFHFRLSHTHYKTVDVRLWELRDSPISYCVVSIRGRSTTGHNRGTEVVIKNTDKYSKWTPSETKESPFTSIISGES